MLMICGWLEACGTVGFAGEQRPHRHRLEVVPNVLIMLAPWKKPPCAVAAYHEIRLPGVHCRGGHACQRVRDAVKRKMTGVKATLLDKALSAKIDDFTSGAGYMKLWDTLVFNKTKAALGGRVRIAVSGGAPISQDTKFGLTLS